jgi:hypothetical protein
VPPGRPPGRSILRCRENQFADRGFQNSIRSIVKHHNPLKYRRTDDGDAGGRDRQRGAAQMPAAFRPAPPVACAGCGRPEELDLKARAGPGQASAAEAGDFGFGDSDDANRGIDDAAS